MSARQLASSFPRALCSAAVVVTNAPDSCGLRPDKPARASVCAIKRSRSRWGVHAVEERVQTARLVLDQPENAVQHIDQWNRRPRLRLLQPQLLVRAALREVEEPILALLLLHQRARPARQASRTIQLNRLAVGKDDRGDYPLSGIGDATGRLLRRARMRACHLSEFRS